MKQRSGDTPSLLRDADIRVALHRELAHEGEAKDQLVVNELTVAMGISKLDVAVINGRLDGYEIKSDRDSLARLDSQIRQFEQICDRLTVVATERHHARIAASVPSWCGVVVAHAERETITFSPIQQACENPNWDVLALMLLLWQTETVHLAHRLGFHAPRTMPKGLIHTQLAQRIPHDILRTHVLTCLRERSTWSPRQLRS